MMLLLAPVPLITAALVVYAWRSLNNRSEYTPFIAALGLFVMSYLGIAISLWPTIVPGHWAAASQSSRRFC
jgi:cytochrome bd ubiquinol oxidase subunit II